MKRKSSIATTDIEKEKPMSLPDIRDVDPMTQLVLREIQNLKELIAKDKELSAKDKELAANEIASIRESIKTSHDDLVRVPTQLSTAITGLQNLMHTEISYESKITDIKVGYESKISDILNRIVDKNFDRVEALRLEYKSDSKIATQDALTAQKELNRQSNENIILITNKNEALFTKLIDALNTTMNVGFNNLRETMGDLKNNASANQGNTQGKSQTWLWLFAAAAFFFGSIGTVMAIVNFISRLSGK